MALATIALEDDAGGVVAMKLTFCGGRDHQSPAHQVAQLLIAHADSILDRAVDRREPPAPEPSRIIVAQG